MKSIKQTLITIGAGIYFIVACTLFSIVLWASVMWYAVKQMFRGKEI